MPMPKGLNSVNGKTLQRLADHYDEECTNVPQGFIQELRTIASFLGDNSVRLTPAIKDLLVKSGDASPEDSHFGGLTASIRDAIRNS